ncbi:hypothetical protein ATK17_1822 [Branchiibius hedensis]|uniref:Winged helix DNA-binding domain-containing protein n=1 Tax=Branchiibius hedensis TaxID=672460 RepID=A0A2Y8ZW59_9MICO|nr:hypothetical protein [Branchiibius hedensis]PWJ25686.1 hypothetical protein ATK17_1822 [Branchiibius hedensis]SSA34499.1 hypothetical protein SAMN04489750_1822 [Branchiibius hedensis]
MSAPVQRPINSTAEMTAKATKARALRARWLLALSRGEASVPELIAAACQPGGRPLLAVRIDALLGATRTQGTLNRDMALARQRLSVPTGMLDREVTVGWVMRNKGTPVRRLGAVLEVSEMGDLRSRQRAFPAFPFHTDAVLREVWRAAQ